MLTIDGNEEAARIAYLTNEVTALHRIIPASPMGAATMCSAGDKPMKKQDRALMAMHHGNTHVAQVALSRQAQQRAQQQLRRYAQRAHIKLTGEAGAEERRSS
jgi:hypothetical protein